MREPTIIVSRGWNLFCRVSKANELPEVECNRLPPYADDIEHDSIQFSFSEGRVN